MQQFLADSKGRLDVFLAQVTGVSRMRAGQLVRNKTVKVNGRVASKPAQIIDVDDVVEASADGAPATETHLDAVDLRLPILYEDDACIVINKPAGVAVHPAIGIGKDEPTILHGAAFLFHQRKIPFIASHILVHRLDRETTGCLLLAKTPEAHLFLQKQFADRTIAKSYLALVSGIPRQLAAMIDAPIGRSTIHRTKMSVQNTAHTREAKTTYHVLASASGTSLLQCDLHTGRTHQLRVHLTSIGHPILGDVTYTNRESEKKSKELGIENLCLHAWKLRFHSPAVAEDVAIDAPLPATLNTSLAAAGMEFTAQ